MIDNDGVPTQIVPSRKHKVKTVHLTPVPDSIGESSSATSSTLPNHPIPPKASLSSSSGTGTDEDSPSSKKSNDLPSPFPSPPSPLNSARSAVFLSASAPSPAGSVPPSPARITATLTPFRDFTIPGFNSFPAAPLPTTESVTTTEANPSVQQPSSQPVVSSVENPLESRLPTPSTTSPVATPLKPQLPLPSVAVSELSLLEPQVPQPKPSNAVQPEPEPGRPIISRVQSQLIHDPDKVEDQDSPQIRPSFTFIRKPSEFRSKPGEEVGNPRFSRKSMSHVLTGLPKEWLEDSPKIKDSTEGEVPETHAVPLPSMKKTEANATAVLGFDIESGNNWFYLACYGVLSNPLRSGALFLAGVASMYLVNLWEQSARQFFSHFQVSSYNYTSSDHQVVRGVGAAIALSFVALAAISQYCCRTKTYNLRGEMLHSADNYHGLQ